LEDLVKISEDKKLLEMMKSGGKLDEEDELLDSIINAGKNEMVDRLIGYLQQMLERKIPMVPYARLAGVDGMRLSRAALGVMIKFSDYLVDTVLLCKDEIDLMWMDLESAEPAERDAKIKESLKSLPHFDALIKRWESASKMRVWINEKKTNLSERLKKTVEAEYKKKKEEEAKAAAESSEAKKEKTKEEAKEETKEESKTDEPVKVDDIEMIDTSSTPKS
jgi:hypothetical protein